MAIVEHGELQVVVPVGFLLTEPQEVTVSVDRPGAAPLPVRLLLSPRAHDDIPEPFTVSTPTPLGTMWSARVRVEDYYEPEYGGGD